MSAGPEVRAGKNVVYEEGDRQLVFIARQAPTQIALSALLPVVASDLGEG